MEAPSNIYREHMSQIIQSSSAVKNQVFSLFPKYKYGIKGSSGNYMHVEVIRFLDGKNKVHTNLCDVIKSTLEEFKTTKVLILTI